MVVSHRRLTAGSVVLSHGSSWEIFGTQSGTKARFSPSTNRQSTNVP